MRFFFFDNNFWNASIIALAQTARLSIHSLSKALHVSVYVYISVYWYKLCVLVNRERQRKNQTDRRRQRFPEDRSQGTWSLPVYYLGLSCLQTPHMCREFDRAVLISYGFWSIHQLIPYEFRVYILQDRQLLHTKGFKCLLFNVWSRREACS